MKTCASNLVEIFQHDGAGYKPLVYFEGWRVAILNDHEKFRRENTQYLEKHLLTDESFVLLRGTCSLYIGESCDDAPGSIISLEMEPEKIYNVKKGVWHNLKMTTGTALLIVENADTSKENSRFFTVTPDQLPNK